MPTLKSSDLEMHYEVDDFTDPWTKPETILLLHGNAESGLAWWGWVPQLARQYRVVRPDMRGFGRSTPMPRDFPWTLDVIIDDYIRLMDALGIERFHLVGAKIGGTIARAFAARRPDRVLTLTVVGTPPPFREGAAERVPELVKGFAENGVEPWARRTMAGRLGDAFPPEGVEWWTKFMGRTDRNTQIGFMKLIAIADIRADIPKIRCPTLVITTEESGLASTEQTRAWQQQIPGSKLLVLPGNSYHVAVSDAEKCARATLDFIAQSGVKTLPKKNFLSAWASFAMLLWQHVLAPFSAPPESALKPIRRGRCGSSSPTLPAAARTSSGRVVAQKLTDAFGQQVVVDNRGGAGGGHRHGNRRALGAGRLHAADGADESRDQPQRLQQAALRHRRKISRPSRSALRRRSCSRHTRQYR